eukprot:CAMPEP_0114151386 /NCGR_PEP_ID=MMETSP0043_2-20121206/23224_1 /TAXON_ID=464988 /ORGANISM="Hemiselmis andersenii, Strain CCMP644" /LENGTH=80 /DNA_ID=CAMNT_0001246211 /DNA_START=29 /DNA_END=272 /DNA_ORIENTATION=-
MDRISSKVEIAIVTDGGEQHLRVDGGGLTLSPPSSAEVGGCEAHPTAHTISQVLFSARAMPEQGLGVEGARVGPRDKLGR